MFRYIVIFLLIGNLYVQAQYPKNLRPPLNGPLKITGNFGELRKNHFHTGIDFSVNRKIGIPIYAVADGYLSRVKVSSKGYGKVVYLTHYNSYKSVYAHLSRFSRKIENFVRDKQFQAEKTELDLYLDSNKIPIKKGEIIGYSGNSGYSFGAHLHFEIRDLKDRPINPQLFGFRVYDTRKPQIKTIVIYPATDTSLANFKHAPVIKPVQVVEGKYHLAPPIVVYGAVFFGIEAYDYTNSTNSPNAIYSVKMYIDDTLWLEYHFERLSFLFQRHINSFVDYKLRNTSKYRIQRSVVQPGNQLPIYDSVKNNGIVVFYDNDFHIVKYVVSDIYGNKRTIDFQVKNTTKMQKYKLRQHIDYDTLLNFNNDNYLIYNNLELFFDKNTFFDNIRFKVDTLERPTDAISSAFLVGDYFLPIAKPAVVSIKPEKIPENKKQILMVCETYNGKKQFFKTRYLQNYFSALSKDLGKFYLIVDTIKPQVKLLKKYKNKKLTNYSRIVFNVNDNTDIDDYTGFINGHWAPFYYDKKNNIIIYNFDKFVKQGKNNIVLFVKDLAGNTTIYQYEFYR